MKFKLLIAVTTILLAACGSNEGSNSEVRNTGYNSAGPDTANIEAPTAFADTVHRCYLWTKNRDTITMQVSQTGEAVNGQLTFNFYEKDDNQGIVDGIMVGDTLIANYTFKAEGTVSIREVAFLKQGEDFAMGSGEMKNQQNQSVFTDRSKLSFKELTLKRVSCGE